MSEVENVAVVERVVSDSAYGIVSGIKSHLSECKDASFVKNETKFDVDWGCKKCGKVWSISVRKLRNSKSDVRLREFGTKENMSLMMDLFR